MKSQRLLEPGVAVRIGRAPGPDVWSVPWENRLSRSPSIEMELEDDGLRVHCLESARNGFSFDGVLVREAHLQGGDSFQVGETSFQFVDFLKESRVADEIRVFGEDELRTLVGDNKTHHIEALAEVPGLMIESPSDQMLAERLVELLMRTVKRAAAAAVIVAEPDSDEEGDSQLLSWQSRDAGRTTLVPSQRLVASALKDKVSVLHTWDANADEDEQLYTYDEKRDWAFCVPIQHDALRGWCLYISGLSRSPVSMDMSDENLRLDLRFIELLAEFIGATSQVRRLEDVQTGMSRFFSPKIIHLLSEQNEDIDSVLKPRSSDIGVLFCDLRGFSKASEENQDDLVAMLARVSAALEVMTRHIMEEDGVVTDFQGDSALGFWGWPTQPDDGPVASCRAALAIQREFQAKSIEEDSPLSGFRVGVGVAWGNAVAGRIGPDQIIKVGVFGPVVNLCSRLEGMTKMMRVPILIDEQTAASVRESMPRDEGRCRRLCRVQPAGMEKPLVISELLPPESDDTISDEQIILYEKALDTFIAGDWTEAIDMLGELPIRDRGKDFLMIHIAQNHYEPPSGWNGTVVLTSK